MEKPNLLLANKRVYTRNSDGEVISMIEYNGKGLITKDIIGEIVSTYKYTVDGLLIEKQSTAGARLFNTKYFYNENGVQISSLNANYSYSINKLDNEGNIVSTIYKALTDIDFIMEDIFRYNEKGLKIYFKCAVTGFETFYAYDENNLLIVEESKPKYRKYNYNDKLQVISMEDKYGNIVERASYDDNGLMIENVEFVEGDVDKINYYTYEDII